MKARPATPHQKTAQKKSASRKPAPTKAALKSASSPEPIDDLAPKRVSEILRRLEAAYPNAQCALDHRNAWELLVATILSAQCTDARVNVVTPELFRKYPTPEAMAAAPIAALEEEIRSTGFYHNKAKSISGAAKQVVERFGGKVPKTMEELLTLPGVARKTANVVLGVAFGIASGVVVDTHVLRVSRRLSLTEAEDPKKVEQNLTAALPRDHWISFALEIVLHGRQVCVARKPHCIDCTLETICHSPDKTWSSWTPAVKNSGKTKESTRR